MTLHGIPGEGSGDTYWPAEVWDGRRGLLAECAEAVCVVVFWSGGDITSECKKCDKNMVLYMLVIIATNGYIVNQTNRLGSRNKNFTLEQLS